MITLAMESGEKHATALSEAALQLSRYRDEHADELRVQRGNADDQQAALEARLRVEEEKCAAKHVAHAAVEAAHTATEAQLAELQRAHIERTGHCNVPSTTALRKRLPS